MRVVLRSLILLPCLAALAACGGPTQQAQATAESSAAPSPRHTDPDGFPLRLQALGTEPFWGVRVDGEVLLYTTPLDPRGRRLRAERRGGADALVFAGEDGQDVFSLTLRRGECSDGMSDTVYPYVAGFMIGNQSLEGCARALPVTAEPVAQAR